MPEFLVHFDITIPPNTLTVEQIDAMYAAEADAARPYLENGSFTRVWRVPGSRAHWAIWTAPDADYVHRAYASFPFWKGGFGVATVHPLAINPNDPAYRRSQVIPADFTLPLTYRSLVHYLAQHGTAGDSDHGEGMTAELLPGVSIHDHPDSGRPFQLHFMVDGQKIAEIGPPTAADGTEGDVAPGYIDFLAEWDGRPVAHEAWKDRIMADNGLSTYPSYEGARKAARVTMVPLV